MGRRDIDKAPREKKIQGYRVAPGRTIIEMIEDELRHACRAHINASQRLERSPGDRMLLNKQKTARGMIRAYAVSIQCMNGPHPDEDEVITNIERRFMKEAKANAVQQEHEA